MHIEIREFGPPSVLVPVDAPDPVPQEGQVMIDCEVAGVTYVETQVRAGTPPWPGPPPSLPLVLGNGVGGRVVAVGPGGDERLVGRRVVAATGGSGGYAERALVAQDNLFDVPGRVGMADAVAALADGRTAAAVVRAAGISPGDRVLVLAAAGGVGSWLVQLAANAGAEVVGAAGSEHKRGTVLELGAAGWLNYSTADWAAGEAFDAVLDGVGGEVGEAAARTALIHGRIVLFGAASGGFTPRTAVADGVSVSTLQQLVKSDADNRALVEQVLAQTAAGRLRALIGQTVPLARASEAHRAIEARTTIGKTVLAT